MAIFRKAYYTGRFIMFSVTTNIYNKNIKGPTLMELCTVIGKLKKFFFWQLEIFDVCNTGDTAHIDKIFKFLLHKRHHGDACVATTWIMYRCVPCHPWCTHRTSLFVKKKLFQFSCGCEQFHSSRSFGFLVINVCNHGEHYETPVFISYFHALICICWFQLPYLIA